MKIIILHAPAGHGHVKAATVMGKVLNQQGNAPLEVIVQDALSFGPAFFKQGYLNLYFQCVKYFPKLWGLSYKYFDQGELLYYPSKPIRRFMNGITSYKLIEYLVKEKPDVIISTHFYASEIIGNAKQKGQLSTHLITVVTDFFGHALWINPGTDSYWVMDELTRQDLICRGVPSEQITAGGIPVDSAFKPSGTKTSILQKYNFDPNKFTLLISSGSFGIGAYDELLLSLEAFSDKIQCFVVCGNNKALESSLTLKKFAFPTVVFGFVDNMPELMEASDLMITKSGGLTSSESLAKGIPMIVTRPIPGQETRNVDFLKENECSFFIEEPLQIKLLLQTILENKSILERKKLAIKKIAKPDSAQHLADYVLSLRKSTHEPKLQTTHA